MKFPNPKMQAKLSEALAAVTPVIVIVSSEPTITILSPLTEMVKPLPVIDSYALLLSSRAVRPINISLAEVAASGLMASACPEAVWIAPDSAERRSAK